MRRTRRSTRISYAEPPLDVDDLISENEDSSMRRTRRSTRRSRELDELENQKNQLETEELEFVRPQKRLKPAINPPSKEVFSWENYVSEETLRHVEKTKLPDFPNDSENQVPSLIKTWYYQYVMSWFNNVCDSYVTSILNSVKPLWKDIKFDEILFLEDLCSFSQSPNTNIESNDDNTNNNSLTGNLVQLIKLRLLRLLLNSKKIELKQWDSVIKEQLKLYYPDHIIDSNLRFDALPFAKQFECYYYLINIIENKSMTFKNYLNSHLDLFQFPTIKNDKCESSQIMVLPTHGSIIEINTIFSDADDSNKFRVPIKLKNCTIIKENKQNNEKELIHLDYSNEIDSYLKSIKIQYNVMSWDWPSFIEYIKVNPTTFLTDFIEIKMAHLLYSSKLIAQREKAKYIASLMINRKRSSRLAAREEESKKREINDTIQDKLDERMHFLKNRHRSLSKYNKRLKDIFWNILWYKFDQDIKLMKLRDKNIQKLINDNEKLTETDTRIINNGTYFTQSIIDIDDESMYIHDSCNNDPEQMIQEIPTNLCIDENDIKLAEENDIDLNNIDKPDVKGWIFHCICDNSSFEKFDIEKDSYKEDIINNEFICNRKLICCDLCNIWEHWDCQPQENIDYLSQMHAPIPKKGGNIPQVKQLTEKDFGIVILGKYTGQSFIESNRHRLRKRVEHDDDDYDHIDDTVNNRRISYRRSARLASLEQEQNYENEYKSESPDNSNNTISTLRPTDLRPRYGQTSPYICGFCMRHWERELRAVFVPELEIIRAKQRKGHDDRERRKKKKLEKKRLEEILKVNNNNNGMMIVNTSMKVEEQQQQQQQQQIGTTSINTNTNVNTTHENKTSTNGLAPSVDTITTSQTTLGVDINPIITSNNTSTDVTTANATTLE